MEPAAGVAVFVAAAAGASDPVYAFAGDVHELAAGGAPSPVDWAAAAPDGAAVAALVGTYRVPRVGTVRVRTAPGRPGLLLADVQRRQSVLLSLERGGGGGGSGVPPGRAWRARAVDAGVVFEGPAERASGMVVRLWGQVLHARRVADGEEGE